MKRLYTFFMAAALCLSSNAATPINVVNGISQELAVSRAAIVGNITYDLTFNIPASKTEAVKGNAKITFIYKGGKTDLQLDFQGAPSQFDGLCVVNGKQIAVAWQDEHILIPRKALRRGKNIISMSFISGDKSLNRNADYLYTLFVPEHARSVFPCFDQPDLKALFRTRLNVPEGWETITSVSTERIPTYLFSFVAGKFSKHTQERNGRTFTALYRETDAKKVAQLDTVFDIADHSIRWFEDYTGIKYPFSSYGFVVLPGYQFGGMEHPGAIQFTDHEIFLGEHPTPEELQTRALSTDRTQGTHPIQQQLDNLNSAGLLYGNIIYQKSPVMMRKLEEQMGASRFRQGLQEYLNTYSYSNATWDELINILDRYAPEAHLKEFSEAWVKQKGMPTVTTQWNDGKLIITQSDPFKRGLTWQQSFLVDAIYINKVENDGAKQTRITTTTIPVDMQGDKKEIALAKRPDYIVPNADGSGYGLFVFDNFDNIPLPTDDLRRFALAMNMYENYLAHGIDAKSLSDTMHSWLKAENNALIASQLVSYWGGAVSAMSDTDRHLQEQQMWQEYRNATIASVKQRLIRQLYNTVSDESVTDSIYNVWSDKSDPLLSKTDYTQIAYRLAILKPQQWQKYCRNSAPDSLMLMR